MPLLSDHQSKTIVKLLLEGDPGTGKTSALVSLVADGFKLRILDFDNLLTPLRLRIQEKCPDKLPNVSYITLRDKMKMTEAGAMVDGTPRALMAAQKALDKWPEDDLGVPSTWGEDTILVVDSLTRLSDAAMNWGEFITPSGKGGKDGRAIVGEAQRAITPMLSFLTSESFRCNVIVIAHLKDGEGVEGLPKRYPNAPGNKLSPLIPSWFDSVLQAEVDASGKYVLRLASTSLVTLKNPVGNAIPLTLPLDTGLAEFFRKVKGAK